MTGIDTLLAEERRYPPPPEFAAQANVGPDAYERDLTGVRNGQGRPIELLSSARLLLDGRRRLLAAIMGYDVAQFQLFVALGQPPTLVVPGSEAQCAAR